VAETVGYDAVAELSKRFGLNYDIHGTPSIALGAYDVTPLEIAGAYTVFANAGEKAATSMISMVRADDGRIIYTHKPKKERVLDPRVAYMMVNLMEEVLRSGTGAGARARGFTLPAAGKTGTSRDGWFAGFTSELLCIVWVGFDDGRDINMEGAHSALPIWTEFMKRASAYRAYRKARPFEAPDGIVSVEVDALTGMLATGACPQHRTEVFIAGTQPVNSCTLHGERGQPVLVAGWDQPPAAAEPVKPIEPQPRAVHVIRETPPPAEAVEQAPAPEASQTEDEKPKEKKKRKGFFGRLADVFR
jgi:penicillin-binding protein 1B